MNLNKYTIDYRVMSGVYIIEKDDIYYIYIRPSIILKKRFCSLFQAKEWIKNKPLKELLAMPYRFIAK